MELNSAVKERISNLIEDPSLAVASDKESLEQATAAYPYFKPLHMLLAKVTQETGAVERASFYSNGKRSYEFIYAEEPSPAMPVALQDEQEVFDEISEVDSIEFKHGDENPSALAPESFVEVETEENDHSEVEAEATVFFVPDKGNGDYITTIAPEIETVTPDEPEHATISKYDDENLPYTFLWWLAKTRAEHSQLFQPYAAQKKTPESGPLQQQYVENIFHLQAGLMEDGKEPAAINDAHYKEQGLINAFLINDPQIKPPPVNKLDNENKARKSAEDHNDVVSETLAGIYIEQMLYRKAIDTYEKLSLKFPEKSRYFADLIKSLEKKI